MGCVTRRELLAGGAVLASRSVVPGTDAGDREWRTDHGTGAGSHGRGVQRAPTDGDGGGDGDRRGPAPERRLFLDGEGELVGRVPNGPETVYLYRYGNPLPGASGVEVWDGSGRVENADRARAAVADYAWLETVRALEPRRGSLRTQVEAIADRTREISNALDGPEAVLGATVDRIDALESEFTIEVGFETVSLWDALTRAYPSVRAVESAVRTTHEAIGEWLGVSERANRVLPPLAEFLGGIDEPESVDLGRAAELIGGGRDAVEALGAEAGEILGEIERIEEDAEEALADLDQSNERIVADVERALGTDLGPAGAVLGAGLGAGLDAITDALGGIIDTLFARVVDPLLEPLRTFRTDAEEARSALETSPPTGELRESLAAEWEQRQDAGFVVDVTMSGLGAGALLVLLNSWIEPMEPEGV